MTTNKKVGQGDKRLNQTANQRAMANPEVREALNVLRTRWNDLSLQQQSEQLHKLIGLKCSLRGLEKELGKPLTSLRRIIERTDHPEKGNDWIETMERTWAVDPEEQSAMSADEDACRFPSKIPAKKLVGPAIAETYPVQDHAHTSTARQTKKITSPPSTTGKESPAANGAMSRQEVQVGEDTPKTSQNDAYTSREQSFKNKIQRLAAIPEQIKPRPIWTARSIKRQGRPLPPTDRT